MRSLHAADCGILLDVNNIYVSSQNHNFDPMDYVNSIPAERVAQITSPGTRNLRSTRSTRMTILFSILYGGCTLVPSNDAAQPQRCSSGTTIFPPLKRSTVKRSKRIVSCSLPSQDVPADMPQLEEVHV